MGLFLLVHIQFIKPDGELRLMLTFQGSGIVFGPFFSACANNPSRILDAQRRQPEHKGSSGRNWMTSPHLEHFRTEKHPLCWPVTAFGLGGDTSAPPDPFLCAGAFNTEPPAPNFEQRDLPLSHASLLPLPHRLSLGEATPLENARHCVDTTGSPDPHRKAMPPSQHRTRPAAPRRPGARGAGTRGQARPGPVSHLEILSSYSCFKS